MSKIIIKILKIDKNAKIDLPKYQTQGSAGFDLAAYLTKPVTIEPMERILIPTGLAMAIIFGYEGEIRPRSGISFKHGITLINSPGTIDSDYRGEILLPVINLSVKPYTINNGERLAQMIINKIEKVKLKFVDILDDTARGQGGFGST